MTSSHANHNPRVVINGQAGKAPLTLAAQGAGAAVTLDAAGTSDPDGNALRYSWLFYPEAGSGIPTQPVFAGPPFAMPPGGNRNEGGIPSFGPAGLPPVIEHVTIQNATTSRAIVTPRPPASRTSFSSSRTRGHRGRHNFISASGAVNLQIESQTRRVTKSQSRRFSESKSRKV